MKVLAFDQSTRRSGWAYFVDGQYIKSGVVDMFKSTLDTDERSFEMAKELWKIIKNNCICPQYPLATISPPHTIVDKKAFIITYAYSYPYTYPQFARHNCVLRIRLQPLFYKKSEKQCLHYLNKIKKGKKIA